eukprot:scaffold246_cov181-Ochromonas_danica.AAC.4
MHAITRIVCQTVEYWLCLTEFLLGRRKYSDSTRFSSDLHAKVQVFSLSLIFKLWSHKHYRSSSFQQDMLDNLRNVAVPGTGIPLSVFCQYKIVALIFVYLFNPVLCLLGAIHKARVTTLSFSDCLEAVAENFEENLLHPTDWFSLWRMNCRLVTYHSFVTKSSEYKMEDKWTFLVQGKELGVPVSPYFDKIQAIVCKNKLIEGGMGIHFFKNAAFGGDWIIQEKLENAGWLNDLLPGNAPLSTMRIITTSSYSLSEDYPRKKGLSLRVASAIQQEVEDDLLAKQEREQQQATTRSVNTTASVTVSYSNGETACFSGTSAASDQSSLLGRNLSHDHCEINDMEVKLDASNPQSQWAEHGYDQEQVQRFIRAESAVLRLGRANAATDHSSILFDVDIASGLIKGGTTNSHWYRLGLSEAMQTPWLPHYSNLQCHLDEPYPQVAGKYVPNMAEAVSIVTKAHYKMMAEVPIVGWDVAFTPKGVFLLEVRHRKRVHSLVTCIFNIPCVVVAWLSDIL